jgi:hypothetical protein
LSEVRAFTDDAGPVYSSSRIDDPDNRSSAIFGCPCGGNRYVPEAEVEAEVADDPDRASG